MKPSKTLTREVAHQEIARLLDYAAKAPAKDGQHAVELAVRIAQKLRLRLSKDQKKRFCKRCFAYFIPGKTLMVRIDKGRVAYHCLSCKAVLRHPYLREQKAKRK